MSAMRPTHFLRNLLLLDAGTCIAMGLLLIVGARSIAGLTGMPPVFLRIAGAALLPVAAFMVVTARQAIPPAWAVRTIIVGNLLWIGGSLGVIFGGWIALSPLGTAFVGLQAAVVSLLTGLEELVWRRLGNDRATARTGSVLPSVVGILASASLLLGCELRDVPGLESEVRIEAEEAEIAELFQRLAAAVNARDYPSVRASLASDWRYFTSGGRQVDFEGWKELISDYVEIHLQVADLHPRLTEAGELAWATFRGRVRGEIETGTVDMHLRFTAILRKTEAGWEVRHLQSTRTEEPFRP